MQLSAANLIIASQQAARANARPSPEAAAQFAGALAKEKGVEGAGFEPMDFKSAPQKPQSTPAAAPSAPYSGAMRIGATVDIRV
ncbi:MAG: hypothetical protein JSR60_16045 [Proteobacteria bacterium]|nr:hypothetical protein [Pseudomonadota bacterium]